MATAGRHDQGLATRIVVELDGVVVPGVNGVDDLGLRRDAVEFRDGADPDDAVRRLPGRERGGDLRLTRALTTDLTFEAWARGPGPLGTPVATRDLRVRFLDRQGDPVRRYRVVGAWARGLEVTGSTVPGARGLLEVLTVSYDACVPE